MKKQSVPSSLTQAFKEATKSEIINSNMLRREQEAKKVDFQVKTSRKLQKYELNRPWLGRPEMKKENAS